MKFFFFDKTLVNKNFLFYKILHKQLLSIKCCKNFCVQFSMRSSKKSTTEKINISFHLKISYSSVQFTNMRRIFRRNGNLSHTLKPIIIERTSYCIQFEIGIETVKVLRFIKISQASEPIMIDLSKWRELESRRVREFRKELAMSKSPSRKKYGFSYDSIEKYFDEVVDLGYGNSFHSLTSEHLLQMTNFEKMVEFDIFFRDPKKCFSPLRISIHDWRKIETIRDRRYKKEKLKTHNDNLALFWMKTWCGT